MEQIALIAKSNVIYWSPVILTLASAGAGCLFLGLYITNGKRILAGACALPLATGLSILLARLLHWYCLPNRYDGFAAALTQVFGGYALAGVFAGCLLAAGILRVLKVSDSAMKMLDCMCIAGSAGIAVGRLSSLFNSSNRGPVLETLRSLPWVYPVSNHISGLPEYRLATFTLQALMAAALFAGLFFLYMKQRRTGKNHPGDITLLFTLIYSASQIVLDSPRYDSLYFRSNGFVSVVQVLSALGLVLSLVILAVKLVKAQGFRWTYLLLWAVTFLMLGMAGYMEYYVQRHGNQAGLAYGIMSGSLVLVVTGSLWTWKKTHEVTYRGKYDKRGV